ncbi:MAG TPA: dihydropteroate synthase, partial [Actinomycetota bacterium]|nr:dihydropteroate synthase [Actinomycetota bacterium]
MTAAWRCRDRLLPIGPRTLVMGILNVTPDSFSDGGRYLDPEQAVRHARQLVDDGADIIDVGGESTRPGAEPVDEAEERRRVVPVIEALAAEVPVALSIDTMKSGVARAALAAGAVIVNDVSALRADPAMAAVVAGEGAGVVLMHMLGEP